MEVLDAEPIIEALRQNDVIGVYGIPEIGKTVDQALHHRKTVNLIADRNALKNGEFHYEVFLFMDTYYNSVILQREFAKKLGLENVHYWLEKDLKEVIEKTLRKWDHKVVILNDVNPAFSIQGFGIGECKIVVTSTEEDICIKMGSKNNIHVYDLNSGPWADFKKSSGDWASKAGSNSIAKWLVHKCRAMVSVENTDPITSRAYQFLTDDSLRRQVPVEVIISDTLQDHDTRWNLIHVFLRENSLTIEAMEEASMLLKSEAVISGLPAAKVKERLEKIKSQRTEVQDDDEHWTINM